jgi:uncharacterized protein YutD
MDDLGIVLFAGSYLRDAALSWFRPYMEEYTQIKGGATKYDYILRDYDNFKGVMQDFFGDTDRQNTLERSITNLMQKGRASEYGSLF